jgi:precorrin-6y C5,15-methyltransferase (decarboxylating) CbiE subunit
MKSIKAYIVGVGPGDSEHVTPKAIKAITESEIILGWELDLAPVRDLVEDRKVFLQNVHNFMEVAREAVEEAKRTGERLAVLRIGDPCVSSGLGELLEMLKAFEVEIIPGISSVQLGAAIAGINLDDSALVSFHDYGDPEAEKAFMLNAFGAGRHVVVLTSPDLQPNEAAHHLISNGVDELTLAYVCSRLSLPEQSILKASLREIQTMKDFHWLSIMIIINPNVPSPLEARKTWEAWRQMNKPTVVGE